MNEAGEELKTSRGYTGKGVATYSNGDTYDGFFKDGVSFYYLLKSFINFRKEKEKMVHILITLMELKR